MQGDLERTASAVSKLKEENTLLKQQRTPQAQEPQDAEEVDALAAEQVRAGARAVGRSGWGSSGWSTWPCWLLGTAIVHVVGRCCTWHTHTPPSICPLCPAARCARLQVRLQMEALLAEKAKLAQENARLLRENTGLQVQGQPGHGEQWRCLLLPRCLHSRAAPRGSHELTVPCCHVAPN